MPISQAQAKDLLALVFAIDAEFKKNLSQKSFPPASTVGQYPRLRTGNLRSGLGWSPKSVAEVASAGRVVIGYEERAFYGAILEVKLGRLGLLKSAQDVVAKKGGQLSDEVALTLARV